MRNFESLIGFKFTLLPVKCLSKNTSVASMIMDKVKFDISVM